MLLNSFKTDGNPDSNQENLSWPELNAEWESGNESQSTFCMRKNININTFTYWRNKFISKKNKKSKSASSFIPVQIKVEKSQSLLPLVIENTSGVKIIIPVSVSINQLSEILKLVGFHHAKN
jgi:hypothetical protein